MTDLHIKFMKLALNEASKAAQEDEVPIGAIIIYDNQVISTAYNKKEGLNCATKHAEILAIEEAAKKLDRWRLSECTIYTTLEPCLMCTGAIHQSRISTLVYGAPDPKGGAIDHGFALKGSKHLHHELEVVSGILETECSEILKNFFRAKR